MSPAPPETVIAVDWSGRRDPRGALALAEVREGRVVAFRDDFRSHDAVARHLLDAHEAAARDGPLLVGLDFAFGFPAAFCARRGLADVEALWRLAAHDGEAWLGCPPGLPFWGRPGASARRADGWGDPRWTDRRLEGERGPTPKSPYQVGGAGAVGTSTIRGMPVLARLRAAGARIWPFDAPGPTTVVEIYPRRFTGPVVKSSATARLAAALAVRDRLAPALAGRVLDAIAARDDAFDAVCAALAMWDRRESVPAMPAAVAPPLTLEGWIWDPARPLPTPGAA